MNRGEAGLSAVPVFGHKDYGEPAIFTPANLLREARRQKALPEGTVPRICVLDPDGDIVEHLRQTGRAEPNPYWACYHTRMHDFVQDGVSYTNQMASVEGDFEKGAASGSTDALAVLGSTARRWMAGSGRAKPSVDDGDGSPRRPRER